MGNNRNYILNFGPQHPAAHGVLRLLLELNGEIVVSADPHIGFLHRGTEKLIESKTYNQAIPYFDRLDYVSMMTQEHGFVLAVEYLLNQKVPVRAQYIRVLFDELTRLLNHIMCLTTHALDVGALTPFLWGFEEREKLLYFYEQVSGARMHAAYYCVGGVVYDLPDYLLIEIRNFLPEYASFINVLDDLLSENPIWVSRLGGIGVVDKISALSYSFSGPVLRGSGVPWDLRKLQTYEVYKELNFRIPVTTSGDSYSRYLVRLAEMQESLNLINQCVSWLLNCPGPVKHVQSSVSKERAKSSMEELILYFKENSVGYSVPEGVVLSLIEAPKGETGVLLCSHGPVLNKPYRCKIKSPGFFHLQALEFLSANARIADVVTNIGSLDIVFGEIDR